MPSSKYTDHLLQQYARHQISRREFMRRLTAVGVSAGLITSMSAPAAQAAEPKYGGRLIVGGEAAQVQDSLDPTMYYSTTNILMGNAAHDLLVGRGPDLQPIPRLATSWTPSDDALSWVFDLRKGVTFHDGSNFGADDVIYSMTRHFREGTPSQAKVYMGQIASIDKLSEHQVRFNLKAPNADFPVLLSDFRIHVTKNGLEDFTGTPPCIGPFKVIDFIPGSRYLFARNENYWGDEGPYVDELEVIGIGDNTARINALISGDINLMLQLDYKATQLIANSSDTYIIDAPSAAVTNIAMLMDRAPTDNIDFRLAMKYAIDREGIRDNILKGHGMVGNDHPIAPIDPYYNADIPQRTYDPEKARFHIRKAGLENVAIDIYGSDVAATGALASAQHLQQSAKVAGINLNVINPPADSFWSAVWIQKPIVVSGWDPRPVPDLMFGIAFASESAWNETLWKNVCAAYAPLIFGLCSAVLLLERRFMSSPGSPGRGHCEAIAGWA
jgi:peptide/nickel transport system substrate-binding protein